MQNRTQEWFEEAFRNAPVCVVECDGDGQCVWFNTRFRNTMGIARQDLQGKRLRDLVHPNDRDSFDALISRGPASGHQEEFRFNNAAGVEIWLKTILTHSPDPDAPGFVLIGEDLTVVRVGMKKAARVLDDTEHSAARERAFLKDILMSVTEGRLRWCENAAALPSPLASYCDPIPVKQETLSDIRLCIRQAGQSCGFTDNRIEDLVSAVGEAAMNALLHAKDGETFVRTNGKDCLQVWVEDRGDGISMSPLYLSEMAKHSQVEANSPGHGFLMMLKMVDTVYLFTGSRGTTVVLEQDESLLKAPWTSW